MPVFNVQLLLPLLLFSHSHVQVNAIPPVYDTTINNDEQKTAYLLCLSHCSRVEFLFRS